MRVTIASAEPERCAPGLLLRRQLAGEDRDEDDVVDAEHDLEHRQRQQARSRSRGSVIQSMGRQATAAPVGGARTGAAVGRMGRSVGVAREDGGDVAGIRVSGRGEAAGPPDVLTIATRVSVGRPAGGRRGGRGRRLRRHPAAPGDGRRRGGHRGRLHHRLHARAGARPGRPPSHHRLPRRALGDRGGARPRPGRRGPRCRHHVVG